jgi:hypothetical protein
MQEALGIEGDDDKVKEDAELEFYGNFFSTHIKDVLESKKWTLGNESEGRYTWGYADLFTTEVSVMLDGR